MVGTSRIHGVRVFLHIGRQNEDLVLELSHPAPGSKPIAFDRPFAASTLQQFRVLMMRWFRIYWRHPGYNATRYAFCVTLAVFLGTIYLWFGQRRYRHATTDYRQSTHLSKEQPAVSLF